MWVPNNFYLEDAGVGDSYEQASAYLDATVGDQVPQYLKDAYLVRGPEMIKYLHENTEHVRWEYTLGIQIIIRSCLAENLVGGQSKPNFSTFINWARMKKYA